MAWRNRRCRLPVTHVRKKPWVRLLVRITEPFLAPFRALIPPLGGIDFSPIVAFFVLSMIKRLLLGLIGF